MWEPIVKENKLYGFSLNPLGKKPMILRDSENSSDVDTVKAWVKEEANRRLVEVDESEYDWWNIDGIDYFYLNYEGKNIRNTDTFTADESNGKLINIKIA